MRLREFNQFIQKNSAQSIGSRGWDSLNNEPVGQMLAPQG